MSIEAFVRPFIDRVRKWFDKTARHEEPGEPYVSSRCFFCRGGEVGCPICEGRGVYTQPVSWALTDYKTDPQRTARGERQ